MVLEHFLLFCVRVVGIYFRIFQNPAVHSKIHQEFPQFGAFQGTRINVVKKSLNRRTTVAFNMSEYSINAVSTSLKVLQATGL
jgi:hypothetical protein